MISFDQIRALEDLAQRLHGGTEAVDAYTFQSLAGHVDEVCDLISRGNAHWKAETVDILIHCLCLLERHGVSPEEIDALIDRRLGRFREKITTALREKDHT